MKILADENCDRLLIAELRQRGFDVLSVWEQAPGIGDDLVYVWAADEGRVLVTNDQGFGEVADRKTAHRPAGIVLMRLARLSPAARAMAAAGAIRLRGDTLLEHFTVVEPHQVRSRPYKS